MGEHQGLQAVAATVGTPEALLELAGGHAALGVELAALGHPHLGKADHHAAKEAQDKSCLGIAHSAVILAQGHIQGVMQCALNDPVTAFELEEARRIHRFEREAAN